MINFTLRNQTDIIFGRGTENECGRLMKECGVSKILIHHSGEVFVRPLVEKVKELLKLENLDYIELDGVVPNPRLQLIYKGIELCRREKVDGVLAIGGGSVIDSAKGIAAGVPYEGDVWDFYLGKCPEKSLALGVISTFAGTGTETTRASVVTKEDERLKRTLDDADVIKPKFAIMNPELTFTIPAYQTACGVSDILSHLMENYFSVTPQADFSDWMLIAGLKTVLKHGPVAVTEPDNYWARGELMLVSPFAINGICKMGRSGDWACHFIEHEMSGEWNIPHGAGLAVVYPRWMRYVMPDNVDLFARFANRVFNIDYDFDDPKKTALAGIEATEAFFDKIGMPRNFTGLGVKDVNDAVLRKLADRIPYYGPGDTIGSVQPLNRHDCLNIMKMCC